MFRLIKGRGKYGDSIRDSGEEYNETISTLHILIREAVKLERKSNALKHVNINSSNKKKQSFSNILSRIYFKREKMIQLHIFPLSRGEEFHPFYFFLL